MKVITIKQPFASMIAAGIKEYEFRTWKTKYRGEILIHAGKGIDKKAMKKFEGYGLDYPAGCIIAKAVLSDCVEVNDELLRSANLHETTEADKKKLSEAYRLAKVIDLRTDLEKQQKPDAVPDAIEYVSNPIFEERVFGISHEKMAPGEQGKVQIPALEDLYRMMVTEDMCRVNFGRAVRLVMEHDFTAGSVLWHCTEGKDRCGLLAVFLLSALGVERKAIVEDYLLTNETNVPKAQAAYQQLLAIGKPEGMAEAVKNIFLAKESYLNAAFEVIGKQFGGMENYLREGLGIPEETILRFREKVLC